MNDTEEKKRLNEERNGKAPWKKWGPYLSDRQWGTVREDYSENGDAWNFFTHDQARSRAYRWGEDGLGGISDEKQRLCFALALWNGRDPILKERLFGLTNSEGNHGEDVKEYYFYLDSTPTHSYMKYLYKYPQAAFPYADLVETNKRRSREEMEYELLDTGVFNDDRYFDVFVEYAKAGPEDILMKDHRRKSRAGRGRTASAADPLVPQRLGDVGGPTRRKNRRSGRPGVRRARARSRRPIPRSGRTTSTVKAMSPLLFTENETNHAKLGMDYPDAGPYLKDGINDYVVDGRSGRGEPRPAGNQGLGAPPPEDRSPPVGDGAPAPHAPGRRPLSAIPRSRAPSRSGWTSTRSSPRGGRRPTRSTRR